MHSDTTVGRRADGVTGSPAQAWPPAGTAWTPDGAWTVDPWGSPGVARTSDPAPAPLDDLLAALPAQRAGRPAAPSWELPMAWLAGHLPLTLIMDLSMPYGPHSRELLDSEPPR